MAEQITLRCSKCSVRQTIDLSIAQKAVDTKSYVFCPNGHPGVPALKSSKKTSTKKVGSKK